MGICANVDDRFPNFFFAAFGSEQLLVLLKALIEVSCTCVEDIVEHMSNLDGVTVLF